MADQSVVDPDGHGTCSVDPLAWPAGPEDGRDSGPGCHPLTAAWRCEPAAVIPDPWCWGEGRRAWARAKLMAVTCARTGCTAQGRRCQGSDPPGPIEKAATRTRSSRTTIPAGYVDVLVVTVRLDLDAPAGAEPLHSKQPGETVYHTNNTCDVGASIPEGGRRAGGGELTARWVSSGMRWPRSVTVAGNAARRTVPGANQAPTFEGGLARRDKRSRRQASVGAPHVG